jgi:hypothetical protein
MTNFVDTFRTVIKLGEEKSPTKWLYGEWRENANEAAQDFRILLTEDLRSQFTLWEIHISIEVLTAEEALHRKAENAYSDDVQSLRDSEDEELDDWD